MAEFYDAFMLSDESFGDLVDYYFKVASEMEESSHFVDILYERSLEREDACCSLNGVQ